MHKKCHCDNQEGNQCKPCETEQQQVMHELVDPWAGFGQRDSGPWSINSLFGKQYPEVAYV